MAIPHGFIQDLLARVDVVDVVGRYVQLKKTGANLSGLCPFHSEKSPSFTVSPSKQFYHCFGCGKNGDAIRFLVEHNGMTFVDAVKELAQQHGLQVPDDRPLSPQARNRAAAQQQKKTTLSAVLEQAASAYQQQLKTAPQAVDYLKSRGLTGQIAAHFRIGYAPEGWHYLSSVFPHYADPLLQECGLVIQHDSANSSQQRLYDRFRHRVLFPIRNIKGECIGFGGRVLDNSKPKYLNSPETPIFSKGRELYGLFEARDALRQHGYALVAEGYMDVVALAQWGFANAVATLGTACTAEHVHKLFRYTDHIVFSFDGDRAGRRAAHKALLAALPFASDTRSVKFLFLPPEHDPDSYIRTHGADAFDAAVKSALPLSQFLLQSAATGLDMDSAEGRAHLASNARPMWQALPEGALKTQLLNELATRIHITATELRQLWESTQQAQSPQAPSANNQGYAENTQIHQRGNKPYPQHSAPDWPGSPSGASASWQPTPSGHAPARTWQPRRPSTPEGAHLPRLQPTSRADHALRLLLLNMALWDKLHPDLHTLLCQLPPPHGALFVWLDAQFHEHGPLGWTALHEALHQHIAGEFASALVARHQSLHTPDAPVPLDEIRTELQYVLRQLVKEQLNHQASNALLHNDLSRFAAIDRQRKNFEHYTIEL